MGIELRMPNINGNEREQLIQIRSYLYQIIPQLQWALNNVETTKVSEEVALKAVRQAMIGMPSSSPAPVNAELTFDKLKPLIIKSAEIVEAYYEVINRKLEGQYVAESDFGNFMQKTEQEITETSSYVDRKFENTQVIISEMEFGIRGDMDTLDANFSNALSETDSRITEETKALNDSLAQTNQEIVNVGARIDATNEAIVETNARIDDANEKINVVEDSIEATNRRIDDVNDSIAATNEEISGVNDLITKANGKIDGLTDAINDTNDNIDILIEAKNLNAEDVEKLNTELSKINTSIGEINTTVEGIESDVSTIDNHVKEVDGQIVDINGSVSNVEELAAGLNESVGDVESAIKDTNAKVDDTSGAVANLKAAVEDTSGKVAELDTAIGNANKGIDNLNTMIVETTAHIRSGLLDDTVFPPVYGLEVGQKDTVNGVETFNKYARFTAGRLSFYDKNDSEVAYISDYKLYISNAEITSSFKMGGFISTVKSKGDVVEKWLGGNG